MHRISVFLFVLISAVAGVLLIILPWTPEWTDNYLLLSFPPLRDIVSNGFFRGICSGLGPARHLDRFLGGAALPRTTTSVARLLSETAYSANRCKVLNNLHNVSRQ